MALVDHKEHLALVVTVLHLDSVVHRAFLAHQDLVDILVHKAHQDSVVHKDKSEIQVTLDSLDTQVKMEHQFHYKEQLPTIHHYHQVRPQVIYGSHWIMGMDGYLMERMAGQM